MVVVENLVYILDTEVSSMASPLSVSYVIHVNVESFTYKYGFSCVVSFVLYLQDVLSVWDLQLFVMTHCWPHFAIHDFELTTEFGSTFMVPYVFMLKHIVGMNTEGDEPH